MFQKYTLKDFTPLIMLFTIITALVFARQFMYGFNFSNIMPDFMAFFFLIFGGFKILNLTGFVQAYRMYDLLAQRSEWYAYAYPFIEVGLGILYLKRWFLVPANIVTIIIMGIGAVGVGRALRSGREIECACLGIVFKIPMTYVTLAEDVLMAFMAAIMLVQSIS